MDDTKILELYFGRDERALTETKEKYGSYCKKIAFNILDSNEDAEECLNDALFSVWNSVPPNRPENLRAYISRIVRNVSVNRYRYNSGAKRGGGEYTKALDELISYASLESVEDSVLMAECSQAINSFLGTLPERERSIFLGRYYYGYSVCYIASAYNLGEAHVRTILSRTCRKLRNYLQKEEII